MDYSRPSLADRLAAEYVLGTLRGPARRRFQGLLTAHPALRDAVGQWEQRLAPLAGAVDEVAPPQRVWQGIEQRLFGAAGPAAAGLVWWDRLALWRGLGALASVVAVVMTVLVVRTPSALPPVVVVLGADPQAQQLAASFVLSVSGDGRALVLRPLSAPALTPAQALELWAVPAQGAPRSLGLVRAAETTTVLRPQLLRDTAAFAVSVEPAGGSPTGAPTGPIVSVGRI